jgi:hypothetical protein
MVWDLFLSTVENFQKHEKKRILNDMVFSLKMWTGANNGSMEKLVK